MKVVFFFTLCCLECLIIIFSNMFSNEMFLQEKSGFCGLFFVLFFFPWECCLPSELTQENLGKLLHLESAKIGFLSQVSLGENMKYLEVYEIHIFGEVKIFQAIIIPHFFSCFNKLEETLTNHYFLSLSGACFNNNP